MEVLLIPARRPLSALSIDVGVDIVDFAKCFSFSGGVETLSGGFGLR